MKHLVKVINAARLIASAILLCLSIASLYAIAIGHYGHIITTAGYLTITYLLIKNK